MDITLEQRSEAKLQQNTPNMEDTRSLSDMQLIESTEHTPEHTEGETLQRFSWTLRKAVVLASLCLVDVLLYGSLTVLQPFYPSEASTKGMSETVVGFLFATYPFVAFIAAPFVGKLIPICGPRCVLLIGNFVGGVSLVSFGIAFAFGGVSCETSVMSILIEEFSEKPGLAMGILETFAGVGYSVGPVLGGVLYTASGFKTPFLVMGFAMIAAMPVLFLTLKNIQGSGNPRRKSPSMFKALKIPGVFMLAICLSTSGMTVGFQEPILGPHLKQQMELNATQIGLVFLINAGVYAILAPGVGWIGDRTQWYRYIILLGFVGAGAGYLLMGPAPFLTFFVPTKEVWVPCVAMLVNGFFCGFLFVSLMPDLLNTARVNGMPDNLSSSGVLSGIFSSMNNLGLTIGPSLAGILVQHLGFQWATAIASFICFGQALLLAVFTLCERVCTAKENLRTSCIIQDATEEDGF